MIFQFSVERGTILHSSFWCITRILDIEIRAHGLAGPSRTLAVMKCLVLPDEWVLRGSKTFGFKIPRCAGNSSFVEFHGAFVPLYATATNTPSWPNSSQSVQGLLCFMKMLRCVFSPRKQDKVNFVASGFGSRGASNFEAPEGSFFCWDLCGKMYVHNHTWPPINECNLWVDWPLYKLSLFIYSSSFVDHLKNIWNFIIQYFLQCSTLYITLESCSCIMHVRMHHVPH